MLDGDGCSAACAVQPFQIEGPWQLTVDYGFGAIGTEFLAFTSTSPTEFNGRLDFDCGTAVLDQGIRKVATCSITPDAPTGQVSGAVIDFPASGFISGEVTYSAPFDFLTCHPLVRSIAQRKLRGVGRRDAHGILRVTGTIELFDVELFDAAGALCYSLQSGGPYPYVMRPNNVPVGTNVMVAPLDGGTITFDAVAAEGRAGVTALPNPTGDVPPNFQLLDAEVFWSVTTNAETSGGILTCLPYPDADQDGIVDGTAPPVLETSVVLLHEEDGAFVDRTVSRDVLANQICAETTTLSPFAPAVPVITSTTTTSTSSTTSTTVPAPIPSSSPFGRLLLALLLALALGEALRRRATGS